MPIWTTSGFSRGCRFMVCMKSEYLVMEIANFVHSLTSCIGRQSIISMCAKKWPNRYISNSICCHHTWCNELKEHKPLYEGYVPMKYKHYQKKMKKSGEWGDHVTLQAAADRFAAKICLLTSFRDTCFIEIVPRNQAPQRGKYLMLFYMTQLLTL
ncbi:hypothetical protein Cgig2_023392 [Carnegiea gigantea]|uniref:OTU domain-containing protein n=1 Tax=Carnegiea gigantea TaxID=171969 RepID=A0A9Q1GMQ5_9CARY|nr:hypothetical protein Cgig2_023392 [Carnegiea gigantea]